SYRLPGIHPVIRIAPSHVALHTREFAACAVSDEARLAAADGAYGLAATVLDVLHDPVLAAAVAEEFEASGGAIDVPAYFDWPRGRLPTVPRPPPGGPAAASRRSRPRGHRSPPLAPAHRPLIRRPGRRPSAAPSPITPTRGKPMSHASAPQKTGLTDRLLNRVEWAGNKLPEPFMLFLILFAITGVVSTA